MGGLFYADKINLIKYEDKKMVASSSINRRINQPFQSRGGGSKGAIAAIISAGSPTGQFYREGDFSPSLAQMQGVSGFDVAGHVATVVAEQADPLSRAAITANSFIDYYPNSKKIHLGSLID